MPKKHNFAIWEGVYDQWQDAPAIGAAFDSSQWLDDQSVLARKELDDYLGNEDFIPPNAVTQDYILPIVVALSGDGERPLRVLDFGGGLASSYLPLRASLCVDDEIEFHVVESEGICNKGKEVFSEHKNLFFHSDLPVDKHFDVIHAGRSLQYVDDWRGLLRSFAELTPTYLVLAGVLAGDIQPFVSIQNYYGHKIRVRFLNLPELLAEAELRGFKLLNKSLHVSKRLGKTGPLPMDNFPPTQRLEYPCQLLFKMCPQ